MEENCIFAQFARGEQRPARVVFEDDDLLAFHDHNPRSRVHVLIIPKKPIESLAHLEPGDEKIVTKMIWRATLLAQELGIAETGYRVRFNVGKGGGQTVFYLHLHLQGGLGEPS